MRNLDPQQKVAVETDARRVLVLAGAGSGKTRVLVERIAYLIEQRQVSPYEICSFTFTRKAAGELQRRLEERLGPRAHRVTARTMHSLALNMVHRFGELIGLRPQNITVYSEWESEFLLREVATDLGIYKKGKWKIPKKQVDAAFSTFYSQGIAPAFGEPLAELFDAFIARCRENNALTYGALLIALRYLVPELRSLLHFRHILVDEVQDIDPLQWAIINGLVDVFGAELFVVGDVDQSIYEWRGAVPDYLVREASRFQVYRIETNYRSSAGIVGAANRLIEFNWGRLPKTMRPIFLRDDREDVMVRRDVDSEAIVSLIADPVPLLVTVLGRNHVLLKKVASLLDARGVPYFYVGNKTELVNSEIFRRVHAFFKLLVNPFDNFAFMLIRDRIWIDAVAYGAIREAAAASGRSHFETWLASAEGPWADFFRSEENHASLLSAVTELHRIYQSLGISVVEESLGFVYAWMAANPAPTWEGENPVVRYLDWLALYDIQDEIAGVYPGITLMTIHASKGLEFDTVLVAGCNEGILPSAQSIKSEDGERALESERRLAYVAWTRAKHLLVLTVRPEISEVNGRRYESPASRFLNESFGGEPNA